MSASPVHRTLVRVIGDLLTAWQSRRVVAGMAGLDDHMLRDIGVSRQDVLSVLAEPLYRDPSACLADRAEAMRHARRATVLAVSAEMRGAERSPRAA